MTWIFSKQWFKQHAEINFTSEVSMQKQTKKLRHQPSIDPDRVENPPHCHLKPSVDMELDRI